jgi:hypothetical protein
VDVNAADNTSEGAAEMASDAHNEPDHVAATPAVSDSLTRRSFLLSVGASTAAAAAAGLPAFASPGSQAHDWSAIAKLSADAFRVAVNEWIAQANVQGGRVSGSTAVLPAGSLVSPVDIGKRMYDLLSAYQVPPAVSTPIASVLAASWQEWAAGYQMQITGAYPALAAVPAPSAPATKASVSPLLSQGNSAGEVSLKAPLLTSRLIATLRAQRLDPGLGSPDQAMQALASWVEASFNQWKAGVRVTSLEGRGPVPTYAPPYVPVGPVIRGVTANAGSLFAGPRFGIVTP